MREATAAETVERLGRVLDRAGRHPPARRRGWCMVKGQAPGAARHLNATLHYLTVQVPIGRPAAA